MRISDSDGYALLFALWVLMILAAFTQLFLIEARQGRRTAATAGEVARVQLLLDGAINSTIVTLFDPTRTPGISLDGRWEEKSILGENVAIRATSENGKLNINLASSDTIASFLPSAVDGEASDPSATREQVERIVAWRNPEDPTKAQSEIAHYTDAQRPYVPRFAPFRSPEELRLTLGMNETSFRRIAPLVTVWSSQNSIQMGVASNAMLEVLGAGGNRLAQSELEARQKGKQGGLAGFLQIGDAIEIETRYESEFVRMSRRAIVRISGDRRHPYEISSWR